MRRGRLKFELSGKLIGYSKDAAAIGAKRCHSSELFRYFQKKTGRKAEGWQRQVRKER